MVGTSGQGQAHRKHSVNAVISIFSVKVFWDLGPGLRSRWQCPWPGGLAEEDLGLGCGPLAWDAEAQRGPSPLSGGEGADGRLFSVAA